MQVITDLSQYKIQTGDDEEYQCLYLSDYRYIDTQIGFLKLSSHIRFCLQPVEIIYDKPDRPLIRKLFDDSSTLFGREELEALATLCIDLIELEAEVKADHGQS